MKFPVTDMNAKNVGEVELDENYFLLEPRKDILHRYVNYQLAKRRAGTAKTKQRNEINATGKKSVRQKGSGGARHGNKRAPIFVGGGVAHGPNPRSHAIKLTKKFKKLALRHALSAKCKAGELVVLDDLKLSNNKTKTAKEAFKKMGLENALFIDANEMDMNFQLAISNIPNIDVLPLKGANVYDILRRNKLVISKAALSNIEERVK